MVKEFVCEKCDSVCDVEIDGHDAAAWCDSCKDYPSGFNDQDFILDYFTFLADRYEDSFKGYDE